MARKTRQSFLEIVVPVVDYQDLKRHAFKPPQRPKSITGKTIALLPNFKTISPPFMEALAQRLARETGVKHAFVHNPDWQFTHPERVGKIAPEVDGLVRECDLMVTGVGD